MANERRKTGIERFFITYFKNFKKILLCNLLFAIPIAVFGAITTIVNIIYFDNLNIVISTSIIFFVFPFYSGVTLVTRNIMRGDKDIPVLKTFLKGFKDNWLRFLIHGFILYILSLITYFSFAFYYALAQSNSTMYAFLVLCIIIAILVLFTFFYVPLITVTFDISLKALYKNSFLMSFGELKRSFFALLGNLLLLLICLTALMFTSNFNIFLLVLIALMCLIIPVSSSCVISFNIYDAIMDIMTNKDERLKDAEDAIRNKGKKLPKPIKTEDVVQDFGDVKISEKGDDNEFIFHNGKMIKRSVLIRETQKFQEIKDVENNE